MVYLLKNQIGCPNSKRIPSNSPKTLSGNHLNLRSDLISETSLTLLKHLANTNFIKRSFLAIILSRRFPNLKNRLFFVGFTNAVDLDVWSTSNSKPVKHVLDSHIVFALVNLQNYFIQRKRTLHTLSW